MTAGLNVQFDLYSMDNLADDSIGGAVVTGTVVAPRSFRGRMEQAKPSFLLLQQGIEVEKIWVVVAKPANLDIREKDEIEPVFPLNHEYINQRFRVDGVETSSHHPSDPRAFRILYVSKREYVHPN